MMNDEILLTLLTGLGIGGIAGAYFTELFKRRTKTQLAEFEERVSRFRSALIYMQVLLYPDQIEHLPVDVLKMYNLKTKKDIEDTLFAEYSRMILFAPDEVQAVKSFMQNPTSTNYWKTLTMMRQALWGKKTKLSLDELILSPTKS
jgi:hypothetical protein